MPNYAVTLSRRYDGLFTASFPDIPDAIGFGRDGDEAIEEATKCLRARLRGRIDGGLPLPAAGTSGTLTIEVDDALLPEAPASPERKLFFGGSGIA